ncbi:MAG TPA: DMT family transporter [Sphingomonadaceae bacterium]|nr:DMT family transporter [Sphingomonadaceae bacterium]
MPQESIRIPFLATLLAIALFSLMDATMKYASIAVGAYSATFLRSLLGFLLALPLWLQNGARWPSKPTLIVHVKRGIVGSFTALTFFYGLVRLPIAEAIAISFIAPLVALMLAAALLKERIGRQARAAAVLGLLGVLVIAFGRTGAEVSHPEAAWGVAAVLLSAVLYAWNLILQRQQALLARPREVAVFQTAIATLVLGLASPWLLVLPDSAGWISIAASAVLALGAVIVMSWAYARAETQALVPLEYTAFLWAILIGWLAFGEALTLPTLLGAGLIIVGCWIAAPRKHIEQTAL